MMRQLILSVASVAIVLGTFIPVGFEPTLQAQPSTVQPAKPENGETQTITITRGKPGVGDVRTETQATTMAMKMVVRVNDDTIERSQNRNEKSVRKIEVLGVNEHSPNKVKVVYSEFVSTTQGDDVEMSEDFDLLNKPMVIEAKASGLDITTENGEPVDSAHTDRILRDFRQLGKPDPFHAILPAGAIKVGQEVDVDAELAKQLFPEDDSSGASFKSMKLKLTGTRKHNEKECAVFAMTLELGSNDEQAMKLSIALKGELLVSLAEGWPQSMMLKGTIAISTDAEATGLAVEGKGEINSTMSFVYSKAK